MRIRLLPLLIVSAAMLLSLRVGGLWEQVDIDLGSASVAQTESGQPATETTPDESGDAQDTPAATDAAEQEPEATEPEATSLEGFPSETDEAGMAPQGQDRAELDLDEVTPAEVKVLEELAARRRELEDRGRDLEFREGLLKATEQRIDEKIQELKQLQAELQSVIDERDEDEEAKIVSLVRIYEKMKPKEAARVFERLEMPLLLSVIGRMKERISAAILAEMDPQRVSEVTAEMAQRDDLALIPQ